MVNLEKWEVIEHKDIREGDKLKIVEVIHKIDRPSKVKVHKGTVTNLFLNGDFDLSDGSEWEDVDPTVYNETVTCYRRKAEDVFTLPKNLGAVIEGEGRKYGFKKRFVKTGNGWNYDGLLYSLYDLETYYKNFVVLSEGVKA